MIQCKLLKAGFSLDGIFREERNFSLSGDLSGETNDHDTKNIIPKIPPRGKRP